MQASETVNTVGMDYQEDPQRDASTAVAISLPEVPSKCYSLDKSPLT